MAEDKADTVQKDGTADAGISAAPQSIFPEKQVLNPLSIPTVRGTEEEKAKSNSKSEMREAAGSTISKYITITILHLPHQPDNPNLTLGRVVAKQMWGASRRVQA